METICRFSGSFCPEVVPNRSAESQTKDAETLPEVVNEIACLRNTNPMLNSPQPLTLNYTPLGTLMKIILLISSSVLHEQKTIPKGDIVNKFTLNPKP